MTDALTRLADAVEAGTATHRDFVADGLPEWISARTAAWNAYNGSLDAAKALHDAVLPEWDVSCLDQASNLAGAPWGCEVAYFNGPNPALNRKSYSRHDFENPARAWLLAIIRALAQVQK